MHAPRFWHENVMAIFWEAAIACISFALGIIICLQMTRMGSPTRGTRSSSVKSSVKCAGGSRNPQLAPFRSLALNSSLDEDTIAQTTRASGAGFRVQFINQSVYIVDEAGGYESRQKRRAGPGVRTIKLFSIELISRALARSLAISVCAHIFIRCLRKHGPPSG